MSASLFAVPPAEYQGPPHVADYHHHTAGSATDSPKAATAIGAAVTASPNTPNRKWLGAMALMQLATNEADNTAVEHRPRPTHATAQSYLPAYESSAESTAMTSYDRI